MLYVTMRSDLPNDQERNQSDSQTSTFFIYKGVMRVTAPYIYVIYIWNHRWPLENRGPSDVHTLQEYSTRPV